MCVVYTNIYTCVCVCVCVYVCGVCFFRDPSGKPYYVNSATGGTTGVLPGAAPPPPPPQQRPPPPAPGVGLPAGWRQVR